MSWQIIHGDARHIPLADKTVQCVVTSPPYWGLRDYKLEPMVWGGREDCGHEWGTLGPEHHPGQVKQTLSGAGPSHEGQTAGSGHFCPCGAWLGVLGLEPTPDLYVQHIVEIFQEVKRVLRDDGTVFLNMGDSYFSSNQRGRPYDISDKEPEDSQGSDCPLIHLCDACLAASSSHIPRSDSPLVAGLGGGSLCPSPAHMGFEIGHLPNGDSSPQKGQRQSSFAKQDQQQVFDHAIEQPSGEKPSTIVESSGQLQAECWHCDNCGVCLSVFRSSERDDRLCAHRSDRMSGNKRPLHPSNDYSGTELSALAYPYSSTAYLKTKDLCMMPARVAMALQADGWWLRSDIIWSKPNPMPESVTDRPTKSHEYLFLLTKSEKYYYDAAAIRTEAKWPDGPNSPQSIASPYGQGFTRRADKQRGHGRRHDGFNDGWDQMTKEEQQALGANRRTVWEIAT
ncbi:hypothetical protein LCGC14_2106340, partial [marine sediment metagenome]